MMQNPYYYPVSYNQVPQIQNGGFVRVRSEQEAREYPIAPGYSVTFIDEGATHLYTKTLGIGQFDRPRFERYLLTKENEPQTAVATDGKGQAVDVSGFALKTDLEAISAQIENIKKELGMKEEEK